jgi:phage-related protein (TIGR01555 family)
MGKRFYKTMVKQQKKSKQPMKVRNIEDLGINTQTGDMLSRALKIYNSPATSYKLPFTLGKPQNNPTVMAMDACINHIIDMCAPEWQALAVPRFLGYPMLSNIAQDPLIRSGIEVIVDDMTRKFIDLTSKGENDLSTSIAELESDLQSFRIKSIFNRALATTGYQGGCLVYVDVGELDDEEKKTPLYLDAATFKKGSFRGLRIIEPINLYPGRYDTLDPTSEDYFNPETWFVLGKEYHRSRFLYFAQNEVPLILKPLYNFFGISLAQQVLEYVQNFTENRRSAQRLLNKFSLTIWRTDMSQFLSGGDCNSLTQRVKYFNAQRSNDGTVLLDKETEEMEQINTPLSGVTDIVSMSLDLAPVILGISKDKYFGDLPKGLNASSEGTNRIYYDKIQSLNEKICYDNVEKVLKILQLNRYGEIDDNISFQFAPLWEMDERERAEINKVKADTAAVYLDRGALSAEEVRGALADNPDSGFSNIDVDDVPETESFADVDLDDRDEAGSVFDEAMDEWDESKHPRAENGQFGNGNGNKKVNTEEKIRKVKIDFSKDNILPELNEEDVEELGVKSKPVLLKKSIIDRNLSQHPEVSKDDYEMLIATALYNADAIIPGNAEKPYYNFIARVSDKKSSVVLLEVADNKDNFEIVHLHWAKDKQRRTLERKGNKINKS